MEPMNTARLLPAYPLFVKDPNFSLWTRFDTLNGGHVTTWFGEKKKVYGFLRTGGKCYSFLGDSRDFLAAGVIPAEQVDLRVTAYTTEYTFRAGAATLVLRFVSPTTPDDPRLLSMPVCYLTWEVTGVDEAEVSLFVNRNICYNDIPATADKTVKGGVLRLGDFEAAMFGLARQLVMSNTDDLAQADWGYWYLSGEEAYLLDEKDLAGYLATGSRAFALTGGEIYLGSLNRALSGSLMLAFDEVVSIDYFGTYLKGYYLENHTVSDALLELRRDEKQIDARLADADVRLRAAANTVGEGGEDYYRILVASLRQSVAAHKLVRDPEGHFLFLSKECHSNGCIGTVDVSYPSMPLYLLANPELVKGMMRPILKFARMPVWQFDFAPHDVGTYPACRGQAYGFKHTGERHYGNYLARNGLTTHLPVYQFPADFDPYDLRYQMPVEECADLLIMFYACYLADGDSALFTSSRDLTDKWVEYLVRYGLRPENQLCTDDFAGHLANNLNLAIKATVGIASYAEMLAAIGDAGAEQYRSVARDYAAEIVKFGEGFPQLPLTWDTDGSTYSLKYNLAFDKLLGLGLFPQEVLEREAETCIRFSDRYGAPLDKRRTFVKSDWLLWMASLTDEPARVRAIIEPVARYLVETKDREPFADWYDAKDGHHYEFLARSVQGGCFILLLSEGTWKRKASSSQEA